MLQSEPRERFLPPGGLVALCREAHPANVSFLCRTSAIAEQSGTLPLCGRSALCVSFCPAGQQVRRNSLQLVCWNRTRSQCVGQTRWGKSASKFWISNNFVRVSHPGPQARGLQCSVSGGTRWQWQTPGDGPRRSSTKVHAPAAGSYPCLSSFWGWCRKLPAAAIPKMRTAEPCSSARIFGPLCDRPRPSAAATLCSQPHCRVARPRRPLFLPLCLPSAWPSSKTTPIFGR